MVVISGDPEELVGLYRIRRMSAHDALLILKRLERHAKPEEMDKINRVRGFLEDEATKENAGAVLRADRRRRMAKGHPLGRRMEMKIIP
jgi:hypothetical protein